MRLGLICYRYPRSSDTRPGGIQTFTQTLARQLSRLGHSVAVISRERDLKSERLLDHDGSVRVFRFRANQWLRPRMFWQRLQFEKVVREIARYERLDVVECFDEGGVLLWGNPGTPLVVRMHNNSIVRHVVRGESAPASNLFFTARLLKRADALVAVSKWVGHKTLEAVGMENATFQTIYNGVNTDLFHPALECRNEKLILFAGAFSQRKGFPTLFTALPKVLLMFPQAKIRCVGSDRRHRETGRLMSEEYLRRIPPDLHDRIELVAPVPHEEMPSEFQRAGLCVFPSRSEGHPFVVIEAMACGAPVVFMRQGPGPEVIEDGIDGLLCDTGSADALAETMIRAMGDPSLRHRIGEAASQRIRKTLSLKLTARENADFYRQVVG